MSTRRETSFAIVGPDGLQQNYRILDSINIDDMMLVMMKSIANEVRNGVPYESPLSKDVRDYLLATHIALES